MRYKRRRVFLALFLALAISVAGTLINNTDVDESGSQIKNVLTAAPDNSTGALDALERLSVKGRAPKTGYSRNVFTNGWREENYCDKRNIILKRDLRNVKIDSDECTVLSGRLFDPYTGKSINFSRGPGTSDDVQIDHIVALSDAWQKGAQVLSYNKRNDFANDPLNLLAVDGKANMKKSDADAATWLPPNKKYRCAYVARQIAVKLKYVLWVTAAEKGAMKRTLHKCPEQVLPIRE